MRRKITELSYSFIQLKGELYMPTEKLSMRKIRKVLQLHHDQKYSNRDIASSLHISSGTVSNYLTRAKIAGITWPLPEESNDSLLYAKLFPPSNKINNTDSVKKTPPDMVKVHKELKRKGVTLLLLWNEYLQNNPSGYGYSRFCQIYREFTGQIEPSMRLHHKAGEKVFVDYSGLTLPWTDKETGEIHTAQIFVAVLGASNYTYVEATESQSLPCWIQSHINTFKFFHGVPTSIIPDNLKSGTTKAHLYDPDINRTYQEMADHYTTAVIPARVRRPKDKAKAEVTVQCIQRQILAPLRDMIFFSVAEINEAIAPRLQQYNDRPFQQLPGSRYSQFIEIDKPALQSLPVIQYQLAQWQKAKAGIDYHVSVDKHYYSIPYRYLKHMIDVRISRTTIEFFYQGNRIALHQRSFQPGLTTLHEHMPKAHQEYAEWTLERLYQWAKKIGSNTANLIDQIMKSYVVPEQSCRSCLGILRMGNRYGNERLEKAAARALYIGSYRYRSIESILKNGLDQQPLPLPASETTAVTTTVHHDNIRGAKYYH